MLDLADARVRTLLQAAGIPYSWGGGSLLTAPKVIPSGVPGTGGGLGIDCSGLQQWAWWILGEIKAGAWGDKGAHDLAMTACDPCNVDELEPGDPLFYQYPGADRITHVATWLGGGLVLNATGGSGNNGDRPDRCVEVRHYTRSKGFVTAAKLKPKFRS